MAVSDAKEIQEIQKAWLLQRMGVAQCREWYGVLTLKFEKGIIQHTNENHSIIPPGANMQKKRGYNQF